MDTLVIIFYARYSLAMPAENRVQKLVELVRTTQNRAAFVNQAHNLINDFSKVTPPSAQDIQSKYPILYKMLTEYYQEASKVFHQEDLTQLLTAMNSLEEVTFTLPLSIVPNTTSYTTVVDALCRWTKENISDTALLNCMPSNELVGGVTIAYGGRCTNLSLDKLLKGRVYA